MAEAVESADDEVGVAQPAVAVIPGAPAPRRLRDRRRGGGDHRPGVLEDMELERQRRPQDLVLEIEGDGAVLAPGAPIGDRPLQEFFGEDFDRPLGGLAVGEDEVAGLIEQERSSVEDVREPGIAREPQFLVVSQICDVVAPGRRLRARAPVIGGRLAAHGDPGGPPCRLQDADEARRPEVTVEFQEAGGEIDHVERGAVLHLELRHKDAGVPHVFLRRGERPCRLYGERAPLVGVEQ